MIHPDTNEVTCCGRVIMLYIITAVLHVSKYKLLFFPRL